MKTASDIFELFGGPLEVARILNVPRQTVYTWRNRNMIPADRDVRLVTVAGQRKLKLTYEMLARIRASQDVH
jgi:DNA invertase Pin-like site-specific DNA recombinase